MRRLAWLLVSILLFNQLTFVLLTIPVAKAQDASEIDSSAAEDEELDDPTLTTEVVDSFNNSNVDSELTELSWLYTDKPPISIPTSDQNTLSDYEVDVRVTSYLNDLVRPVELGGAGLAPVKVARINKNYDTNGLGKYDREIDNGEDQFTSSHHTGQAVDISSVGAVTCKLVARRHLGGSKTTWQAPRDVLVAWQSASGIAAHPTPNVDSLMAASGQLSSQAILEMMNDTGELDAAIDYLKGWDLQSIMTYAGANIFLKNGGFGNISGDPLADSALNMVGYGLVNKSLTGLPNGLVAARNDEDVRIGVTKARLEESLSLPAGSLNGWGWQEILSSAGKRSLENSLGLPTLFLDKNSLEKANQLETVRTALSKFNLNNKAFNLIDGTIGKVQANDSEAYKWAGVNLLADSLRLSSETKQKLETAVRGNLPIDVKVDGAPIRKEVAINDLSNMFSSKKEDQQKAQDSFKSLGQEVVASMISKQVGDARYSGLVSSTLDALVNGSGTITFGAMKAELGSKKLAQDAGLNPNKDAARITGLDQTANQLLADYFNQEFGLTGAPIQFTDMQNMIKDGDVSFLKKIISPKLDRIFGWDSGTGWQFMDNKMTFQDASKQILGNAIGQILGLNLNSGLRLDGDINSSYGTAIVADRLGLKLPDTGVNNQTPAELNQAFGVNFSTNPLAAEFDASQFNDPDNQRALELTDARLGVAAGTSERYLKGEIDGKKLNSLTGEGNFKSLAIDRIWQGFGLDSAFRLTGTEANQLIRGLTNWSGSAQADKNQVLELGLKTVGLRFDQQTAFAIGSFNQLINGNSAAATNMLILQGVREFGKTLAEQIIGAGKSDYFKNYDAELTKLTSRLLGVYTDPNFGETNTLMGQMVDAGIPASHRGDDGLNIVNGSIKLMTNMLSAAAWERFTSEWLPSSYGLSYDLVRNAFIMDDQSTIDATATNLYKEAVLGQETGSFNLDSYHALDAETRDYYGSMARKQIMVNAQKTSEYRLGDAMLAKAGLVVPPDFSKAMFEGSTVDRANALKNFAITELDNQLEIFHIAGVSYRPSTLLDLVDGKISTAEADAVMRPFLQQSGIQLGPFNGEFLNNFYSFLSKPTNDSFYTDSRYGSMWSSLDGFFDSELGFIDLPDGLGKSIYYASQHDWNPDAKTQGVSSLTDIGRDFFSNQLTQWGDNYLKLPIGSTYQIYSAVSNLNTASKALELAKLSETANVTQARASVSQAQKQLYVIAVDMALKSCSACQKVFAAIDSAIAAPAGFTHQLAVGAVAMALGLGPAGLVVAGLTYLTGFYRVDYLCPQPPNDIYALSSFDEEKDQSEYRWSNYYTDPDHPERLANASGSPLLNQTVQQWEATQPFVNGNDQSVWMAWSRYYTGKMLEATMEFGETQGRPISPKQVVTYRRANAEFFAARVPAAFSDTIAALDDGGLGYTQSTTKVTDWVHVAFGGLF